MTLSGSRLSKSFGKISVLEQVSIACNAGEICGLLGMNGAGKTTLFKILLGLLTADSGQLQKTSKRKKAIGGIIEKPALYEYLNASDNLKLFAKIQGAPYHPEDINTYLKNVGLDIERKDVVKNYSMGMKQRLGIAIALLNNPEALILDEPFSGLDPLGIVQLRELVIDLAKNKGLAIIISSHIVEEIRLVSDYLYVINDGKIIKSGATFDVIQKATKQHLLVAESLGSSIAIKELQHRFITETTALVDVGSSEIPDLIKSLVEEGIYINSCTPRCDMQQLFKSAQ